jgi:paraquat-inducible protein A
MKKGRMLLLITLSKNLKPHRFRENASMDFDIKKGYSMTDLPKVIICPVCAQEHQGANIEDNSTVRCARCNSILFEHTHKGLGRALAFSVAALILYFPANIYPILSVKKFGYYSESTIWNGVSQLFSSDYWGVATIVFLASIVIPLVKVTAMIYLISTRQMPGHKRLKLALLRIIRVIGPWSMLDVFLVAILVSLVKLGDLATIKPESGLVAFAAVVVLTILASSSFEPRSFWEGEDQQ